MAQVIFFSPTHKLLASQLISNSAKKISIVDYGCGEGELLNYLDKHKISKYLGLEVNQHSILVARKKWQAHKFFYFDLINKKKLPSLGAKNSVDAVFLVGVVQYLPVADLKHVLSEARRVLKPGGKLLLSSTTDHWIYKWLNIYRFLLPVHTVNREKMLSDIVANKLSIQRQFERGIILTPLFSNIFVLFFDVFDKIFFKTKGELGPVGRKARAIWSPVIKAEFSLNLDYGYTLFIVATK